jgi:hypothetical protein
MLLPGVSYRPYTALSRHVEREREEEHESEEENETARREHGTEGGEG